MNYSYVIDNYEDFLYITEQLWFLTEITQDYSQYDFDNFNILLYFWYDANLYTTKFKSLRIEDSNVFIRHWSDDLFVSCALTQYLALLSVPKSVTNEYTFYYNYIGDQK